jgi:hypothetical protein
MPGLRWGSVWFAPERVAGGLVRTIPEDKVEHSCVGGPYGQGGDRVAGPSRVQLPQQTGEGLRVVETDVSGGIAGQQGGDRVAGPGRRREPKRLRLRLFPAAARLVRRLRLLIAATWPWAIQTTAAITRLQALAPG